MNNLNDVQTLWQNQSSPFSDNRIQGMTSSLFKKMKRLEKKQFRINLFKTLSVAGISLYYIVFLINKSPAFLTSLGLGFILINISGFMFLYWKKQYQITNREMDLNSQNFIHSTINKMSSQRKLFTFYFPIFTFNMIIGLNLFLMNFFSTETSTNRLLIHLGMTFYILIVFLLGTQFRMRKLDREFKPIIQELEMISQDWKE